MSHLNLHAPSRTELHSIGRLISARAPATHAGVVWTAAMLLLRLASATLLVWIGAIHIHLWLEGYRQIPTDGPLFLVDALAGFAVGAVVLFWPRPIVGLFGAGFTFSTLAALIISINVGLFGFKEALGVSFVVLSIGIEAIATLFLLSLCVLGGVSR